MKTNCVVCNETIELEKDEYFVDYSLGSYWCHECAEKEGKED